MWKKLEKPRTVQATKQLIKEFVSMEKLPHDRPLKERRLMVYRRILAAGEFRTVTWASAYCEETDCTYRVNGKHTSLLLSELEEIPEFSVTVERYSCPTLEDVARLYSTFDSKLAARSAGDVVQSFASTVKEFSDLKKKTFSLAVTGLAYDEWGHDYYLHEVPDRAELLLDHIEFVIWLDGILFPNDGDQKEGSHLWRAAVVAAMATTFNKCQRDADKFWKLVRLEDDPVRDTPTRKLARFLSRNTIRSGASAVAPRKGREVVTFREMYVRCLHGWNAFRSNTQTDLKYYPNSGIPSAK